MVIGIAGLFDALLRYYDGIWIPTTWIWGFPYELLKSSFLFRNIGAKLLIASFLFVVFQ
jgi:hypothetical protein